MQKVKDSWESIPSPTIECRGRTGVIQRTVALLLALVMLLTMLLPLSAFAAPTGYEASLDKAIDYLLKEVPKPGYEDEWVVFALARSGAEVPGGYYEGYLSELLKQMDANNGSLPAPAYGTDYSRVALALTALGIDASKFAEYNLLQPLTNVSKVSAQGVTGAIYALLALDAKPYTGEPYDAARLALKDYILSEELPSWGFTTWGTDPEADTTAMAIQALAAYYNDELYPDESAAAGHAAYVLTEYLQDDSGGFGFSWEGVCFPGPDSTAQVIVALTAIEHDPEGYNYTKTGGNPVTALLGYQDASGGFDYPGVGVNMMSSWQATYALAAYGRFLKEETRLYDMSDVQLAPFVRIPVAQEQIDLSKIEVSVDDMAWTGKQLKPTSFTYNGKKYSIGANATVSYGANKNIGKGTVRLTGKGDFSGTKTVTFKIVPKKNAVSKLSVGKKQLKVTWKKVSAAQKVSRYQLRYRVKGSAKWKTKTFASSKSSAVLKGLKKGKTYQVQTRSYKTVAGAKYYSAWSATKFSKKVK